MNYIYVLRDKESGRLYTGYTSDLRKRLSQHRQGLTRSTRGKNYFDLVYYEACLNLKDAQAREKYLKSGMGKRYLKNRLKRFLALTG
jgi:putative endonuclease